MTDIKTEVREFYNQVGWQEVSEGVYQNAAYEDLRPVACDYIHRCHLRVARHLKPQGRYLLDAGSGPIQYPEYQEYSQGYQFRVCADISMVALQEARKRIGTHGLFVVCDIANLPFKPEVFEAVVSLHTIHHLPIDEHPRAYLELYRVMVRQTSAVIVNGWGTAPLANLAARLVRWTESRGARGEEARELLPGSVQSAARNPQPADLAAAMKTFTRKTSAAWLKREIGTRMPVEIRVWRTFSVKFLRAFIQERRGGKMLLRLLYWLEERFPHFLGENGQYPLVVIRKE